MENHKQTEKFKTMIGGQALIEGIMMRGPKKDAIVIRGKDGLTVEVSDRKIPALQAVANDRSDPRERDSKLHTQCPSD